VSQLEQIKAHIKKVLLRYNAKRASLFGSFVRNEATEESDVDVLVEFKETISLLKFISIKFELEDLLKRKVDLVEYSAIKPALRNSILSEQIPVL
jgi:predicted nucleotidyltransferase